jgi:uncharacterized secreted protein with C-terminal beta-propeller domain
MRDLARRTWFTLAVAGAALAAGIAIAGAAVLGTEAGGGPERAEASSRLTAFSSCDRLRGYLRRHRDAVYGGEMPIAVEDVAAAPAADGAAGFGESSPAPAPTEGGTNVQEEGVDEPDVVKTSGSLVYTVSGGRLRVVDTAGGTPAVLGSVELPGGPDVYSYDRELLIAGDRALVITRDYGGFGSSYSPRTVLTELDLSDPAAPTVTSSMNVEGSYVSGRLTGATARVVVSAYPDVPVAETGNGRAWLPRAIVRAGDGQGPRRRSLMACDDVRRPGRFSGTTMLSVLTIDLERGLPAVDTDAVMTGGETVYASPSSLYVATERWRDPTLAETPPAGVTTAIHRFDITDPDETAYVGTGKVDGYMLSQWSMSEHEGVLRVASTSSPPWNGDGTQDSESFITTLVPRGDRLAQVGRLDGIGEGERIYAVRFMGPVGYVVTFRQVDPLHVIDLADPAAPRQAGELKIPGYSAYLHPVGPGLLLGIGQDAGGDGVTRGAQASLFDVSDPANPVRTDHVSLGRNSSTEVEFDHHAFTWSADASLAVVPVSSWMGGGFQGAAGIGVGPEGLTLTPRTTHGSGYRSAIRRTVELGGLFYTVSERGIAVHDPATLERFALTPFAGDA